MQKEEPFLEEIQETLKNLDIGGSAEVEEAIFQRLRPPDEEEILNLMESRPAVLAEDATLRNIAMSAGLLRADTIPTLGGTRFVGQRGPNRPRDPQKVDFVFSEKDKNRLDHFLHLKGKGVEIEASFGTVWQGFRPGFKSFQAFHALRDILEEKASKGKVNRATSTETVEIMNGVPIRRITKIISPTESEVVWQKKMRRNPKTGELSMIENPRLGIRVYHSQETFISEYEAQQEIEKAGFKSDKFDVNLRRTKRRISYTEFSEKSPMRGLRFDLTLVEETRFGKKSFSFIRGEVEIEKQSNYATANGMIDAIRNVLIWSQRAPSFNYVIGLPERKFAVKLHNNLFWPEKEKYEDPYRLKNNYWNKPRNIKIRDLLKDLHWSVTVKLNGSRRFLLIDTYGIYIFGPPFDVIKIGNTATQFSGTLLDGEFMRKKDKNQLHCFDILFMKERDVRPEFFQERQALLKQVVDYLKSLKGLDTKIYMKKFYSEGTLYQRIEEALNVAEELPEDEQDGLIFQPHMWYYNRHTLKWKPPEKLTIDFKVIVDPTDPKKVNLMVGHGKWQIPFMGSPQYPLESPAVTLTKNNVDGESVFYKIVEFRWDKTWQEFDPIRIRDDRDRPNNPETAKDVWNDIMNPISKDTIYGDTLQVARRYFNDVKRDMLITNFSRDDTIIDIGSGRGGDLLKWKKIGFDTVYAVDPNKENLNELERRLEEMRGMKTKIRMINMGAEETEGLKTILKKDNARVDGIVAFFSLTFFTKDSKIYNSLLETIDLLPIGAKFIGIVMDGEKTRELLEESKAEEINVLEIEKRKKMAGVKTKKEKAKIKASYQKEIKEVKKTGAVYTSRAFTITQASRFSENTTGNQIIIDIDDPTSMVKDQKEWLFYFEPFKTSLEKLGFVHQEKPFRTKDKASNFIDMGPVFHILPEPSRVFSSLLRVFIFTKGSKFVKFINNIPKVGASMRLPAPQSDNLSIIRLKSIPSSFIYATLWAEDRDFRKRKGPEAQVEKLRLDMAKDLTFEEFMTLPVAKGIDKKDLKSAFGQFKDHLADSSKFISKYKIIDLLEETLAVNIYVLKGRLENGWITSINVLPSACKMLQKRKAVILYTTDDITFYPVKRKQTFLFAQTDPLIQKLFRESCPQSFV